MTTVRILTGNSIRINRSVFAFPPGPVKSIVGEQHRLPTGVPTWRDGAGLKKTRLVFRTLVPATVRVYGPDGLQYRRGDDYLLDPAWAKLTRKETGRIAIDETVRINYQYRLSRIDLVQQGPQGKVSVKRGLPSLTCPLMPRPDAGCRALATVYLAPETIRLTRRNVYVVRPGKRSGAGPGVRPEKAIERLVAGKPVTVVCFGDSITNYGDASCREKSYFGLFRSYLARRFPAARLRMINAGVGGNTTDDALRRLRSDVLAHRPHLVTIMFGVNDENGPRGTWRTSVPLARYGKNLRAMVQRIRQAGAEVILMGPTLKNPGWWHTSGHLNDYRKTMAGIARQAQVSFADVTGAWLGLKDQGVPFMPYLSTCINHPNDHGHRLIFNALKTVFTSSGTACPVAGKTR